MRAAGIRKGQQSQEAIAAGLNLALASAHLIFGLYVLVIFPVYVLPRGGMWPLTLIGVALLSNSFWSLIHEAIHDLFHPSRRVNVAIGRLLSLLFGSPFRVLRVSHLLHHKLNRSPIEATEIYDPQRTSRLRAGLGYYSQILGGLYLFEVISPLAFFLPRDLLRRLERRYFAGESLSAAWVKSLLNDDAVREIRLDGSAVFLLWPLSAFLYGESWPWLLALLGVRAFLISFLDNVYHYRTPVDDVFYAGNLWLPGLLSKSLLHFNMHGVHHKNPAIPWVRLPEVFRKESRPFDGNYFAAALDQLSGPIPIFDLPRRHR